MRHAGRDGALAVRHPSSLAGCEQRAEDRVVPGEEEVAKGRQIRGASPCACRKKRSLQRGGKVVRFKEREGKGKRERLTLEEEPLLPSIRPKVWDEKRLLLPNGRRKPLLLLS